MSELRKVHYDPIYNFHSGYHREVVTATGDEISWKPSSVTNIFEDCVWNNQNVDASSSLINLGYFPNQDSGIYFSPHILLSNNQPYFMELESAQWLFADTYKDAFKNIPEWKIYLMQKYMIDPNLKRVMWHSNTAMARFFADFCSKYGVSDEIQHKMRDISEVVHPSSAKAQRNDSSYSTEGNDFVIVSGRGQSFRKGLDVTVGVFERLQKDGVNNWRLHHFGNDSIPDSTGIDPSRIEVHGQIPTDELTKKLAQFSTFLFPSRADTYGSTIVQAINGNAFVVSTHGLNVPATPEVLDGYPNKVIIPNKETRDEYDEIDVEQLFEVVRDLIIHPRELVRFESSRYSRNRLKAQVAKIVNDIST